MEFINLIINSFYKITNKHDTNIINSNTAINKYKQAFIPNLSDFESKLQTL